MEEREGGCTAEDSDKRREDKGERLDDEAGEGKAARALNGQGKQGEKVSDKLRLRE